LHTPALNKKILKMKIKPAYFFLFLLTALSFLGASQTATSAGSAVATISPSPALELSPVPTPTPVSPSANFLTVSPPVRELELSPGSTNSYQLSLTNQGEQKVRLILRASPFTAAGETGGGWMWPMRSYPILKIG